VEISGVMVGSAVVISVVVVGSAVVLSGGVVGSAVVVSVVVSFIVPVAIEIVCVTSKNIDYLIIYVLS